MNFADKLAQERRARLAAERLLELKQAELFAANKKLGKHARDLSNEIVETRAEVATVRNENRRVKSDLNAANQKIEVIERRLWQSVQTIQDGFAIFDDSNIMIAANNAYLSVFEDLEEVQPGISYPRVLQLLTEEGIIDTEGKTPAQWRATMIQRWQSPSPDPIIIRLWNEQYIKLIDHRGPAGDVVTLALNITPTVLYERRLKEARSKAEAANRAKSAFLANMSHEIRTPMNGVVGMADLLSDSPLSEEQAVYVETIKNSGEALLVIINDILDYSKIEADRLDLNPEAFDLEKSLHEVVTLLQPIARDKGLGVHIDYDMFLPTRFIGDPGRVRQILTNLIGNAMKFTQEGHVLIRVVGDPQPDGSMAIHVAVEDTGIGIAPDKLNMIFGEFNQVDDNRNRLFEGTGLGLAISKRLVERMQGKVWVTSELNVGSCFGFRIVLPRDPEDTSETETDCAHRGLALIIASAAPACAILERQLGALGFKTHRLDAISTPAAASQPEPDLIVIDESAMEHVGTETVSAFCADRPHIPCIVCASERSVLSEMPNLIPSAVCLQKPVQRSGLRLEITKLTRTVPNESARFQTRRRIAVEPSFPESEAIKVLVAEDNMTNQLVFRKMVATLGIDVELTFANNGLEAVEAYRKDRPDMVFMDISMPKMDGKAATSAIKSEFPTTAAPIIAVTAHALDGDAEDLLAAGLDDYLSKPLRKAELASKIEKYRPRSEPVRLAAQP